MIRLDSLDLTLDSGTLPTFDPDRLTLRETTANDTGEVRASYTASGSQIGVHGLSGVLVTDTSVGLRLNAQLMGNDYTDGISKETLPDVCDRINAAGLVLVTPADLLGATVRRADPFADVSTADAGDVAGALRLIGRTLPGARTVGRSRVTLYRKMPDREGTLRGYAKGRQLQLAKHAEFRDAYPGAVAALDGCHRFEIETKSYHAARRLAAIPTGRPMLRDLLDSTRSPVADALDAMLSTWCGRRCALHSLPSVPDSLDSLLSMPSASPSADAYALLASLIVDLVGGDYDAATAAVRARYGSKHGHRLYPAIRAACEAHGRPADATAHADAVDVLRLVSDRVRQREAA